MLHISRFFFGEKTQLTSKGKNIFHIISVFAKKSYNFKLLNGVKFLQEVGSYGHN